MQDTQKTVNVLMFFDDKYFQSALITIQSILDHTKCNLKLYTCKTFNEKNKETLESFNARLSIKYLEGIKEIVDKSYNEYLRAMPPIVLYRIFAPFFIDDIDRILHLDSDLIFTLDVEELFDSELNGKSIGACAGGNCFNAGVMVYDLAKMKAHYSAQVFIDYISKLDHNLPFCDQDILNSFFEKDFQLLDDKFNWRAWNRIIGKKPPQGVILHYLGAFKPFSYRYINFPLSRIFWRYGKKIYGKKAHFAYLVKAHLFWPIAVVRRLLFHVGAD